MDSIDRNRPEDSYEDLQGQDAVKKIKEMVDQTQTCFFCSAVVTGESNGDRPMSVMQADEQGNLWFLSARDSRKNQELAIDPSVKLYFQGSKHADFMQLSGHCCHHHRPGKDQGAMVSHCQDLVYRGRRRSPHLCYQSHAFTGVLLGYQTRTCSGRRKNAAGCSSQKDNG